jgi:hypothetical protein
MPENGEPMSPEYKRIVEELKKDMKLHGCGCGKFALAMGLEYPREGIIHRANRPCYREGESKQVGALAQRVATPEPAPAGRGAVVLEDLVAFLRSRSEFGERKYGTVLRTFNGRDAYLDALQELLDLFVYVHQAQMEAAEWKERAVTAEALAEERLHR